MNYLAENVQSQANRYIEKANLFRLRDYWYAIIVIGILVTAAFALYRGPAIAGPIMQLVVLGLFLRSKKPWIWIFVFMFTSFSPGGLFQIAVPRNLVILSTSLIGDLTFVLAFSLVAILKAARYKEIRVFYRFEWFLILAYLVVLIPVFGGRFTYLFKGFANFSLLISIPMLLRSQNDYDKIFLFTFMGNMFVLFTNLYQVTVGYPLVRAMAGSIFEAVDSNYYLFRVEDVRGMIRPIWGVELAFFSILGALFYITYKKAPFRKLFLYVTVLVGWINIMFTATRGWIIASTLIILIYTFIMIPRFFRGIIIMLPLIVVAFIGVMQVPVVRTQILKSFSRLQTSESLLSGELTIEATGGRSYRNDIVMSKFKENPVIGWGYGRDALEYQDTHTGNQTLLMQFGLIGYALLVVFWLRFVFGLVLRESNGRKDDDYKNTLFVPAVSFLGLFFIHSTSGIQLHPFTGGIFVSFLFSVGNFLYNSRTLASEASLPVMNRSPKEITA
jgi:hypothetical protein